MLIGELARRTGVSPRLLRYYEEQGLLRPERTSGGYRRYAPGDVTAVRHVRTLLAAGLGTVTIAELLPCMVDDGGGPVPGCAELVELLIPERARLDAAIDGLTAARTALDALVEAGRSAPAC